MKFITYDLIFLALFVVGVVIFLYRHRGEKRLERQGILFMYKTRFGIEFIDKFTKKFEKILKPTQYLVLVSGYILTGGIIWMLGQTAYLYIRYPEVRELMGNVPPVAPLIPYAPKLFGLESFFPPLYFTYFLIALAIVALTHEFSHGIFAKLNGFKIHSTGFAFLGPIIGAFVEPDEKTMNCAKKFPQLVVLGAGTFANVLMFVLFGLLMSLFFTSLFVPIGVKFDNYATSVVDVDSIQIMNDSTVQGYVEISAVSGGREGNFFTTQSFLEILQNEKAEQAVVYDDSPAFSWRIPIGAAITKLDGVEITNRKMLGDILSEYAPGDIVNLEVAVMTPGQGTIQEVINYEIELDERDGKAFIGVGFYDSSNKGLIGIVTNLFTKVKNPSLAYSSKIGGFGWFVYYLLWWIVVINILVALFNMLPVGILDGGRFFYLSVCGIFRSEKIGRYAYRLATWFIVITLIIMIGQWVLRFI